MIVYVVTTYTPVGRRVKAAFEDRDQAIYCCAFFEQEDAELEVVDTEAIIISGNKKPLCEWTVYVKPGGVVSEMSQRYTFDETLIFEDDYDGVVVCFTVDTDVPADKVKEMAIDHVRKMRA